MKVLEAIEEARKNPGRVFKKSGYSVCFIWTIGTEEYWTGTLRYSDEKGNPGRHFILGGSDFEEEWEPVQRYKQCGYDEAIRALEEGTMVETRLNTLRVWRLVIFCGEGIFFKDDRTSVVLRADRQFRLLL